MINNLKNKNRKYEVIKKINDIDYFENISSLNIGTIKLNNSIKMFGWDLKILEKLLNNKFSFFSLIPNKSKNRYKNIIYMIIEDEEKIEDNILQLLKEKIMKVTNVELHTNSLQILNLFFKENISTIFIEDKNIQKNKNGYIWNSLRDNFNEYSNAFNAHIFFLRKELQDVFTFKIYPSNEYNNVLNIHTEKDENDLEAIDSDKIMKKLLSSRFISWKENIKIFELEFSKYMISNLIDILYIERKIEALKSSIALNQNSKEKIEEYIQTNLRKIKRLKYQT